MAEKPRPLLEVWHQLNRERHGEPSGLAKQMREAAEGLRRFAEQPHIRETGEGLRKWEQQPHIRQLGETLRQLQERRQLVERMMESPRPVSGKRKNKPGAGRPRSTTSDENERGIELVLSQKPMAPKRAFAKLREAGIGLDVSDDVLRRRIVNVARERRKNS